VLHRFVHNNLLYQCWSPVQIAQRTIVMKDDDPLARLSRESIYAAIYAF